MRKRGKKGNINSSFFFFHISKDCERKVKYSLFEN